jgi:23S rRNA (pseudouridine1915-N3)-methyltransferase
MKIAILAVGRLRAGPEADLVRDYLDRFDKTGRALGLGPARVIEVEDKKNAGRAAEGALLARALPDAAAIVALDERGRTLTSPEFAATLARWRDAGRSEVAFILGGADGIEPALRDRADLVLSFGAMVWPHMLARVMLSEQIYRAATILSGSPYHRA